MNNSAEFYRSVDSAYDFSAVKEGFSTLIPYATTSYISSEFAFCYLRAGKYPKALQNLLPHMTFWTPNQQRDHTIAIVRLLLLTLKMKDYKSAYLFFEKISHLYIASPSYRAAYLLKLISQEINMVGSTGKDKYFQYIKAHIPTLLHI